jgi:adenylylsulfate kinase
MTRDLAWVIWLTGLPGCGKSTLARAVAAALGARGVSVRVLELDEVRRVLTPSPTYSDEERDLVYRALVYMAKLLTEAGVPVLIDATAHRQAWRALARELIPAFAEVRLACPLDVCRQREAAPRAGHAPPGIYAHAGQPGARVPGVDVAYEPSDAVALVVDTGGAEPGRAVQEVLYLARRLERQAARAAARTRLRPIEI